MRRVPALDWVLLAAVLGLSVLGALLVWSATSTRDDLTGGDPTAYLWKQVVNIAIGVGLLVAVLVTDHRWVRIVAPLVYAASLVGLVLVLTMGSTVNGSQSWLMFGGLSIQPSEFAKLAVVIGMALVVAERAEGRWRGQVGLAEVALMLGIAAVPAALIMLQPDLGTMLVLSATVFGVLAAAGAPRRWLALLVGGGVTVALAAVASGALKDYQVDRFLAFMNPDLDPRGASYNVEQARIAIGNGGVFGQGLFDGSQTHAGFVPEQHTDFVFTVAGEELGLVGAGLLIALTAVVIWRALVIARRADGVFGQVAAAGIACWFGFQAFQNIGMCLGIMPVTGVPLPFVSYGGSSMFAGMLAVGLLQNIHLRSREAPAARLAPANGLVIGAARG
jgi:rod shape determining protein RodA